MVDRAIFLAITFVLTAAFLWMLYGCHEVERDTAKSGGDATLLEIGSHLFEVGHGRTCVIAVGENSTDVLFFDKIGNEDGLTFSGGETKLSYTRVVETGKVLIIDKNGDGLPDTRVAHDLEGNLLAKEHLRTLVQSDGD